MLKNASLNPHLTTLKRWFSDHQRAVVALSGGVDSTLVAYLARLFLGRQQVLAVVGVSPSLKTRDLVLAQEFCDRFDVPLRTVPTDELLRSDYRRNPVNRCYYCKQTLYELLHRVGQTHWPGQPYSILNGQNADDGADYRPGHRAAREYGVFHPLADCGLGKQDIRALAAHFKLPNWNKPASPCLSSRIPYGQPVTVEKLQRIEEAEELLTAWGFTHVRVRHPGRTARVEVPAGEIPALKQQWAQIKPRLLALGFADCRIDEEGLISGKLNREAGLV